MSVTALFWWERWACALHWLSLGFTKLKCSCPLDTSLRAEVVLNKFVPYPCLSYTMYSLTKHHIYFKMQSFFSRIALISNYFAPK